MKDKQHPLLTKNQLIDWLIYHCPMKDNAMESHFGKPEVWDQRPFGVRYTPSFDHWYSIYATGSDPMMAYSGAADLIIQNPKIHREITDLYWYCTI